MREEPMAKSEKKQMSEVKKEKDTAPKNGILDQVGSSLKEDLKVTPSEVTDALVQDAKQAVNYEIRRGFRNLISGLFKK